MKNIVLFAVFLFLLNISAYSGWKKAELEKSPLHKGEIGPQNMMFCGIDCPDSVNCYAIANDLFAYRVIHHSTDAGKTWKFLFAPDYEKIDSLGLSHSGARLRAISAPTKDKCLIACDSGIILITEDAGKTWDKVNVPSEPDIDYPMFLIEIKMLDSIYGVACSLRNIIYTKDGGYTWKVLEAPLLENRKNRTIYSIDILSPGKIIYYDGLLVGYQGIMITNDTGKTWKYVDPTNINKDGIMYKYGDYKGGYISKMFFVDSLNGWIVGGDPTGEGDITTHKIAATTDGGNTWYMQHNELGFPNKELWDISFHDTKEGIAVGRLGTVLLTKDSGKNWAIDSSCMEIREGGPLMSYVCFQNVKNPVIALSNGKIFYYEEPVSVIEEDKTQDINIFPNPAKDYIKFNKVIYEKVEIYSMLGVKLLERENVQKIDISSFATGMYFIKIGNKTKIFVKN